MNEIVIIIPARIGSVRLKKKLLQKIDNLSIIEHVYSSVKSFNIVPVSNIYVATDSQEIVKLIRNANGQVIMTSQDCESGTDRVYEAYTKIKNNHDIRYVINIQGDMPFVSFESVNSIVQSIKHNDADIVTPVCDINSELALQLSNVKVVVNNRDYALYFSRSMIPYNAKNYLCHIGIYGFSIHALQKFVKLPVSNLERLEKLEQLRALENSMSIKVCRVNSMPISVDTYQDLKIVREYYYGNKIGDGIII